MRVLLGYIRAVKEGGHKDDQRGRTPLLCERL